MASLPSIPLFLNRCALNFTTISAIFTVNVCIRAWLVAWFVNLDYVQGRRQNKHFDFAVSANLYADIHTHMPYIFQFILRALPQLVSRTPFFFVVVNFLNWIVRVSLLTWISFCLVLFIRFKSKCLESLFFCFVSFLVRHDANNKGVNGLSIARRNRIFITFFFFSSSFFFRMCIVKQFPILDMKRA